MPQKSVYSMRQYKVTVYISVVQIIFNNFVKGMVFVLPESENYFSVSEVECGGVERGEVDLCCRFGVVSESFADDG